MNQSSLCCLVSSPICYRNFKKGWIEGKIFINNFPAYIKNNYATKRRIIQYLLMTNHLCKCLRVTETVTPLAFLSYTE